ncbi:MAG: cbb3-type cytochrome c oxidase subunit I, partial [Acidimicrobiales bacterium]|nr:cbb3-type cytochrome c oxidase subunit I [Acidimicrobiales bacterium]
MRYRSQKVAYLFFATCMLLFSLQIIYGFIMGFAHIGWDGLHSVIPFNVARATHTNLLVVWLLSGFMGAAYYISPEEAERELFSVKAAVVQWASLVLVSVTAIIGFHLNWWEGRKFLEIPRPLDYLVVVNVLLFIGNIGITAWKGRRFTTTGMVLFAGLFSAALLYLPGMIT